MIVCSKWHNSTEQGWDRYPNRPLRLRSLCLDSQEMNTLCETPRIKPVEPLPKEFCVKCLSKFSRAELRKRDAEFLEEYVTVERHVNALRSELNGSNGELAANAEKWRRWITNPNMEADPRMDRIGRQVREYAYAITRKRNTLEQIRVCREAIDKAIRRIDAIAARRAMERAQSDLERSQLTTVWEED